MNARAIVQQAQKLLDVQHAALLDGDLGRLSSLPVELENALQRLKTVRLPAATLEGLRAKASRNAQLVDAARGGVADARKSISSRGHTPLTTYNSSGFQNNVSPSTSRTLARR